MHCLLVLHSHLSLSKHDSSPSLRVPPAQQWAKRLACIIAVGSLPTALPSSPSHLPCRNSLVLVWGLAPQWCSGKTTPALAPDVSYSCSQPIMVILPPLTGSGMDLWLSPGKWGNLSSRGRGASGKSFLAFKRRHKAATCFFLPLILDEDVMSGAAAAAL